jgi:hypothetical protein
MPGPFTAILAAHLLGDFVLQTDWMVRRKRLLWVLLLHAAIVAAVSCLLLGSLDWRIPLAVFLTHSFMDAIKAHLLRDSLASLLADQFAHLAVLLFLAGRFPDVALHGWWAAGLKPDLSRWYFASLSLCSGLVLCVPAGGILIARFTRRFTDEIRDHDIAGLTRGGQYIGWLERSLTLLLVLMGQPGGIGFLIAAKSILRFGEIRDQSQRKVAEYIIIGTFLSFGWALTISVLTLRALKYWIP